MRTVVQYTLRIAVFLLVSAIPVSAEDVSPPASLSLRDCIETAMQNQIDIQVGSNTVAAAKARRDGVLGDYYPRVSVEHTENLAQSGLGTARRTTGTSASVSQSFYDGGLREARVRGARAAVSQDELGLDRTRQIVTFNVTRDYYGLLRSQHLADVQRARVTYLEGQLDMVRARIDLGDAAEVDALPVEAELANARVDVLSAENTIRTSAIRLQNTMGLSPDPVFSIQDVGEPADTELHPVSDYLDRALTSRPEVQQAEAAIRSARSSVDSAKISLRPRVVVAGQYEKSLSGGIGDTVSSNDGALLVTGGVVFDIFDGGINRAAYREGLAGLSTAASRADQVAKDIRSEVRQAYLDLTNSKERIAASDLSVASAQANFEAQEGRYKQGAAIPLDLLNAQLELVTAQSNAVQARYDYYTSIAELEYAIGEPGGLYGN